jgi:hypothetical protein
MNAVSNLLSGLIGALIGAFIAFYINHRSVLDAARHKLLAAVYKIGFDSWHRPRPGQPGTIFHEQYDVLWSLYAELRQCVLLPWSRKRLDKAWQKLMHMDH